VQLALAGRGGEGLRDAAEAFVSAGFVEPHLRRLESARSLDADAMHEGAVTAIELHPSGVRALSGGADGTVRVWDLETGACVRIVEAHPGGVLAVGFAADADGAVSIGRDRATKRIDLGSGRVEPTPIATSRLFAPRALGRIVVDGRVEPVALLESYDRTTARLVSARTGELTATLRSPDHGVTAVAVEASGARALTGGWSGAVELWDLATSRATLLAHVHHAAITAVAFGPSGTSAIAADVEGRLVRWALPSGEPGCGVVAHAGVIEALVVEPELGYASSIGRDRALVVRDAETFARVARWETGERLTCAAVIGIAARHRPGYRVSARPRSDTLLLALGDASGHVAFLELAGTSAPPRL
jgi:WD40 repeat protein